MKSISSQVEYRLQSALPGYDQAVPSPGAGRWHPGLRFKMLSIATLPVLLVGLLTALLLTAQRTASLSSTSQNLADSVARILATTLDVQDVALVTSQLQAAVSSQSVAFVDVRPGGQPLRFFVSKDLDSDWYLRQLYDNYLAHFPGQHQFRFVDGRAAAYREAERLFGAGPAGVGSVGTGSAGVGPAGPGLERGRGGVWAHLSKSEARYAPSEGKVSEFQVVSMEVYELPSGQRRLRGVGDARPAGQLLFTLGIGVSNAGLATLMNQQLSLVLLSCALVACGAALLAHQAARRLVRPILGVTQAAGRISLGDIDTPVEVTSDDETGELAQSLERLRVSLQLALRRLRPGQEG